MSSASPCDSMRLVDAHFSRGGLSPRRERVLREHLPTCVTCRARYERHLLLAEVDRSIPTAQERLARGLGLAAPASRDRGWRAPLALALALGLGTLVLVPRLVAPPRADEGFTPRGGTEARGPATAPPALEVYRVRGGKAEPTQGLVHADDELAFAYRNPEGLPFLMVFATDAAGQVYWYHPSWTDAEASPTSVPAQPGEGARELPEAVRHPLPAGMLVVHALFTREPRSVREVESLLARDAPLAGPDEHLTRLPLEVRP